VEDWRGNALFEKAYKANNSLRTGIGDEKYICQTVDYYTCSYAADDPANAYCTYNYSETTCSGTIDPPGSIGPGTIGVGETPPGGGYGGVSPEIWMVNLAIGTGTLCGSYNWTGVGQGWTTQLNSAGFSLVNTNGQQLYFKFDNLCIQLANTPQRPMQKYEATDIFNDSWAYALGKAVERANNSAVLGEYFVKKNMLTDMQYYFDFHFGRSGSISQDRCYGSGIGQSSPKYCN
jgi:hypothetical protein